MAFKKYIKSKKINVLGAGDIAISEDSNSMIAGTVGFEFGVSWGQHGYIGGVLPELGARELANHILKTLDEKCTATSKNI